jgi:hypothetical protein
VDAHRVSHVMLAHCRRLPRHIILQACSYASHARGCTGSEALIYLHKPTHIGQCRAASPRVCASSANGSPSGAPPNGNGASGGDALQPSADAVQLNGQPLPPSLASAARYASFCQNLPDFAVLVVVVWESAITMLQSSDAHCTCSWPDRNLARKYGLSNEMLQSVMDMPHSQAQTMEQVSCLV